MSARDGNRLQPEQLEQLDQALREGARTHGFPTNLWTLPRIAKVIERLTGVHYDPGHVWKTLKTMRWTLQKPATQARECNVQKVNRWLKETWPALKNAPRHKAWIFFQDESGVSQRPRSVEPGRHETVPLIRSEIFPSMAGKRYRRYFWICYRYGQLFAKDLAELSSSPGCK
jgi:hypothetical protein